MKLLFLLYVFPRTMFSRVRNAMKLSFFSYDDGLLRSKVQNRPNLTLQITFRLGIWIRFIGFRQNLAWTHYLTLGIILWKNFSFLSKSKMAAGGQKIEFRHNFGSKITFRLGKWIPLIRFGQNLARGVIFFLSFLDPIAPENSMNFCGSYKLTCQLFTSFS